MKKWLVYSLSLILLSGLSAVSGRCIPTQAGAWGLGEDADPPDGEAGEPIEEIVITATKTKRELKDLSENVTVITSQEIKELNAHTVEQVLSYQPGIDIQGGNFLASKTKLNMRGLQGQYGAQRVLVLIDGRPVNEEYMGDVDFRSIPVDNIEKIEIVRGPVSALYGSQAMGGVINLITKSGQEKPFTNLKTTVGSFNTYGTILQHGAQYGKLDYFITANDKTSDGYLTSIIDGAQTDWQSQNYTGRVNWVLDENNRFSFSLGWNNGQGNGDMFIQDITRDYQDIVYRTNWSSEKQADFLARVYRNGLDQELEWKIAPTETYEQFTIGSQIQQSIQLLEGHLFTFGLDTKTEDALMEGQGVVNETFNSQAIYVQDEILVNEQIMVTLGLRYDHHEEFGGEVSLKIGAVYHLNEQTKLRSAIGQAYRAPSISDLYLPTTVYGPYTYEGNPDLNPETMWSFELGADHKFTDRLSGGLTLYQSLLKDGYDYMPDPVIYRPRNADMSIAGLEAEAKFEIMEGLEGWANYTYTRAIYEEYETDPSIEDNYVEDIPPSQGSLGLRFRPDNGSTIVNFRIKGSSSRYTDAANTSANKVAHYMIAEVGLTTVINEKSSIFITVHNLFDREYQEVTDYNQPGRWFETGLSIRF